MGQDPSTPGKDCMLCNFAEYAGRVERTMLRASLPSPSLSEMSSSGCSSLSFFGGGSGSCKTQEVVSILIQIAIFPNQTKPGKKLMAICSPKPVGRQISLSHRRRQASVLPGRPGWSPQSVLPSWTQREWRNPAAPETAAFMRYTLSRELSVLHNPQPCPGEGRVVAKFALQEHVLALLVSMSGPSVGGWVRGEGR